MSDHYLGTNHGEVLSNFHYKLSSRTPSTLKTAVHNRLQSEIKCAIAKTSFSEVNWKKRFNPQIGSYYTQRGLWEVPKQKCRLMTKQIENWTFYVMFLAQTDHQSSGIFSMVKCTGKLQNLSEISWFAWVFWLVLCGLCSWFCVVWRLFTVWKNASTWMVCLGKKQLGSTSPWIVPWLVTHMEHLHTCLAEISSFVFTQQTKILLYMGQFFQLHLTAATVRQHMTQRHNHIAQSVMVVDGCDNLLNVAI